MTTQINTADEDVLNTLKQSIRPKTSWEMTECRAEAAFPPNQEVFDCKSIPKFSEFSKRTNDPHRLSLIKDFTPKFHAAIRLNGYSLSKPFKGTSITDKKIEIAFDDTNALIILETTGVQLGYQNTFNVKTAQIGDHEFTIITKGAAFTSIYVRNVTDVALQFNISGKDNSPLSLRGCLIFSDRLHDAPLTWDFWHGIDPAEMMKSLHKFCFKMSRDEYYCHIPSNKDQLSWGLLSKCQVNQYGTVTMKAHTGSEVGLRRSITEDSPTKITLKFTNTGRKTIFDSIFIVSYPSYNRGSLCFTKCYMRLIHPKFLRLTFEMEGGSYITDIRTTFDIQYKPEMFSSVFYDNMASVTIKGLVEEEEIVLISSICD